MGSDALFWPLWVLHVDGTHTCMQLQHPYTQNEKRIIKALTKFFSYRCNKAEQTLTDTMLEVKANAIRQE